MTGNTSPPLVSAGGRIPEVRPLVIATTPAVDESLIGIIASSTAANVLGRTDIILEEVGLNLLKPALVGQHATSSLDRIAAKVGCEAAKLSHRLHPYVDQDAPSDRAKSANGNWTVRWGTGSLYRHHMLLDRRRIAPQTLLTSSHHRWQWLCALLPYCPISLERLVDTCGACGSPLGWTRARGIHRCETCREIVPMASESPLADERSADYRLFAKLISPTPGEREDVLAELHDDVRRLSPTSLITLIVRLGWLFGERAAEPWSFSPASLDQPALGVAVSTGMGMLADWPERFRSEVSIRMRGVTGDERGAMLTRFRKLGDRYAPPDTAQLIRSALPEAFQLTQRALSIDAPTVLSCDICRMTGIDVDDVRKLEDAGVFTAIETRTGERRHVQYPQHEVEEFTRQRRGSQRATKMAEALGLPRYAIEQLLGRGEVRRETHPGVLLLDINLRLATTTVEALFSDLNDRARKDVPPDDAVPLWNAARTVGGRLKNWGELLTRMRAGGIGFWLVPDEQRSLARYSKFVRRVLVVPADVIPALRVLIDDGTLLGVPIADVMSQVDAAEVLNIDAVQMKRVVEAGNLSFEGRGKALWTSRDAVLNLASEYVSSPELSYLLGGYGPRVTKMLYRRQDIHHGSAGWLREDVIRELATLKLSDTPVLRRWSGGGGKLDLAARERCRAGQRLSREC